MEIQERDTVIIDVCTDDTAKAYPINMANPSHIKSIYKQGQYWVDKDTVNLNNDGITRSTKIPKNAIVQCAYHCLSEEELGLNSVVLTADMNHSYLDVCTVIGEGPTLYKVAHVDGYLRCVGIRGNQVYIVHSTDKVTKVSRYALGEEGSIELGATVDVENDGNFADLVFLHIQ